MGLARDLSMGPPKPRGRKPGTGGPWTVLRRLALKPGPLTADELSALRTASETVGTPGYGGRGLRTAELDYWTRANLRYYRETGVRIGPLPTAY
jgi:hypothetical protein